MWRFIGQVSAPGLALGSNLLSGWRPAPKPITPPKEAKAMAATPVEELDKIISALDVKKEEWVNKGCAERAKILRACLATTLETYVEAGAASAEVKGSWGTGAGEEIMSWTPFISGLREYAEALEAQGSPRFHGMRVLDNGQVVVDVFPLGIEAMFFAGFQGEIWIEPGQPASQGALYKKKGSGGGGKGRLSLVLGAGNQVSVVLLDILHKLVADDSVVICKMNPVNSYLGPYVRRALQPLVDDGYVELVYGDRVVGEYLSAHPSIADVHLTGSPNTYDAIVWGDKSKVGEPPYPKPVTAELGCVTPYIIVPGGQWSQSDMEYVAEQVISGLTHNMGHNCVKAEVLVTDKGWEQRDQFLAVLAARLDALPQRSTYYPGSDNRFASFKQQFPDAVAHGSTAQGCKTTPWLLKTGLEPTQANTSTENWCGVLQEVALPGSGDPAAFFSNAVDFVNDKCWGTLSCSMFVHPAVQQQYNAQYEAAIAGLRYGSVCVNVASLMGFCVTKLTWGAYPGHTPQDIVSGNCTVHNTLLFDHPQKSVLRAPWRYYPTPPWSVYHRNLEATAEKVAHFLAAPGVLTLTPVPPVALLG